MKLAVCIIHNRDKNRLFDALLKGGFKFTIISSSGGFLREGNTTLICGVEESEIINFKSIVSENCSSREQVVNVAAYEGTVGGPIFGSPIKVNVGGAVLFFLEVSEFGRV